LTELQAAINRKKAMALLTTFCSSCAQVALTDQRYLLNGRLPCLACGANLRVAPGCSFGEDERELFDELKQVVAERTIKLGEAKSVASQIADVVRSGTDHGLLEQLTTRLPGLVPIQVAAGTNRQARQRALKLLRAILEAMALAERAG
jgi:hypothetical protein